MELKEQINSDNLPKHIAIIMDGNGRWAKEKGKHRVFGHNRGVESVRQTVEAAVEIAGTAQAPTDSVEADGLDATVALGADLVL